MKLLVQAIFVDDEGREQLVTVEAPVRGLAERRVMEGGWERVSGSSDLGPFWFTPGEGLVRP